MTHAETVAQLQADGWQVTDYADVQSAGLLFDGVMLAHVWHGQDVTGWLMSEKLDGVRAYWTGQRMLTRNGRDIALQVWFKASLPPVALDGELWAGRGQFQAVASLVKRNEPGSADWQRVRFAVFDAPETDGFFTTRLAAARKACAGSAVAVVLEHRPVVDRAWLERECESITAAGGEGVMLREPGSLYEPVRSHAMLKYKLPTSAMDAVVLGHVPGKGRHAGRLGALACEWNGRRFKLGNGLADADREKPPAIGCEVRFTCHGFTKAGLPRFPVFVAARAE